MSNVEFVDTSRSFACSGVLNFVPSSANYFRPVDTDVNVVESEVPTAVTAPMITTAIKAAIRPYSMAVAPDSSCAKHRSIFIAVSSFAPTVVVACRCALDVRLDV